MPKKIRLTVTPSTEHSKDIDLPDEWDDLSPTEQEEYLDEEARSFMENTVKFHGEVVDTN